METQPQLYLIAHRVRGEPAFDIAERMKCPICEPIRQGLDDGTAYSGCSACDDEQIWWIIPTSGHRAYPHAWHELSMFKHHLAPGLFDDIPSDWPDHYETHADKGQGKIKDLFSALGFARPTPTINRRL